jgi:hypothetical protein
MEAKEYAKKLIYQYQSIKVAGLGCGESEGNPCLIEFNISQHDARQLALIDVQNTIDAFPKTHNTIYFEQVKQEIINFNPLT